MTSPYALRSKMDMSTFMSNAERLSDFEDYLASLSHDEHQVGALGSHEKEINRLWDALRSSYDVLISEAEKIKSPQIKEIKRKYFDSYSIYTRGLSLITSNMERLKSASQMENA